MAYSTGHEPIALFGKSISSTEEYPNIVPRIEKLVLKSLVLGNSHCAILTDDGIVRTWGQPHVGNLGLGDPFELEVGMPGAFNSAVSAERARQGVHVDFPPVYQPSQVHFDRPGGRSSPFCLALAVGSWHCVALASYVSR